MTEKEQQEIEAAIREYNLATGTDFAEVAGSLGIENPLRWHNVSALRIMPNREMELLSRLQDLNVRKVAISNDPAYLTYRVCIELEYRIPGVGNVLAFEITARAFCRGDDAASVVVDAARDAIRRASKPVGA